jgi:hypothetical protein
MRIEHHHQGTRVGACARCGYPASKHTIRHRTGAAARKHAERSRARRRAIGVGPRKAKVAAPPPAPVGVIAIDGEGFTDPKTGAHHYVYLAAGTAEGETWELYRDGRPLDTGLVLDWLFTLPSKPIKMMFGSGYDATKWFEALDNETIYRLWRPETRTYQTPDGRPVVKPVRFYTTGYHARGRGHEYAANLIATKLSIMRDRQRSGTRWRWKDRVTIWDFFKFFDMALVPALTAWEVGTAIEQARLAKMKAKRPKFTGSAAERAYCLLEVKKMAGLANAFRAACKANGLPLSQFFGPGSLAALMLKRDRAKKQRPHIPKAMVDPVARAFFGGWFEVTRCGPIEEAWVYDLTSAYAAAEAELPCMKHGAWKKVKGTDAEVTRAVRGARLALVHYALPQHPDIDTHELPADALHNTTAGVSGGFDDTPEGATSEEMPPIKRKGISTQAFGPFPFRCPDASLIFPVTSAGGWVWAPEFIAAKDAPQLWPNVVAREAWIFVSRCRCPQPFLESIAHDYGERLRLGESGRGMTLKKALAARYGKRAQNVGSAPFHCQATAGIIISHIRAAILRAIAAAPDPWDIVAISTDAVISRVPLDDLPEPFPVASAATRQASIDASRPREGKYAYPLGAWKSKHEEDGVFIIRPGMRFKLKPSKTDDVRTTAGRGLNPKILHRHRQNVLAAWERAKNDPLRAATAFALEPIFHGAKTSIRRVASKNGTPAKYVRSKEYGRWVAPADPFMVNYSPLPKRPMLHGRSLNTWALFSDEESAPYDRKKSEALKANRDLARASDVAAAQPGGFGGEALIDD